MSHVIARRTDVLIAGAGPTGLALACDLRSRGIDVAIVDKAAAPATTSRALGLQPRGSEILARLGAFDDLSERAVHALAINLHVGERRLARIAVSATPDGITPSVLAIGQSEIESRLRARLAQLGREVMWGSELLAIESQDSGIQESGITATVRSKDGDVVIEADWLIGCDGAHSRVRKLAGIAFDGTAFAERFVLADVRLDWQRPANEVVAWLHRDGMLAAMPLPGNIWRIMAELPTDDDIEVGPGGAPSEAATRDLLHRCFKERLGDTTTRIGEMTWVSVFRFHRRLAPTYRNGRILIAGDAAHIHSPFGGQGMNTGLGDAYNLGWKLAMVAQGRAADGLLDTYEAERRPVAADVLATTTTNTNLMLGNTLASRLVRDFAFLPAMRLPAVRRKMAAKASQLHVGYADGPLAAHTLMSRLARVVRSKPGAGDRGANARCLLPGGKPTTLAEHTSAGWALLLFGADSAAASDCAAAARGRLGKELRVIRIVPPGSAIAERDESAVDIVLRDHRGSIADAYRPGRSEAVLLRPDGHLAWRASRPKAVALCKWFNMALDHDHGTGLGGHDMPLVLAPGFNSP
jgi:4,5-epoxidase